MFKIDSLEVLDGEFIIEIYDLSDEGGNGWELHIDEAAREEITVFPETHVLFPVMYAQFNALKKSYRELAKADDKEAEEYWDDISCGLERSFKAAFNSYRGIFTE